MKTHTSSIVSIENRKRLTKIRREAEKKATLGEAFENDLRAWVKQHNLGGISPKK